MVYKWKGDVKYGVSAQTVGKLFEKIEKKEGSVTNQAVLDSARPEGSVIHNLFEWRDDVAAERYRLVQAGQLIRNLYIETTETETEAPVTVRAMVNVAETREGSYISICKAFSKDETREKVIGDAMRELRAFQKKYQAYKEFSEVFMAIAKLKIA